MRQGQQHQKRMRGRNNNNRKGPNQLNRSFESNGPDVKIRGTAAHIAEKYVQLARDAQSSGDPVSAENYLQHAEHYTRLLGRVLDELGIRRAVLAGHSMGGRLVTQLAAADPDRAIAVVLIDAVVGDCWDRLIKLSRFAPPVMIGLGVLVVASIVGFILAEKRAEEPVLPLRLFANPTFTLASAVGLVVGVAMFGSVTYLPLFLQVVSGATPTESGLQMVPMMGGMLFTSILSGQLISRWGRYRIFPIIGTAVMAVGLLLLSYMDSETSVARASFDMLVLGLGLGLVMQVLVIAVQNSVDYSELGVATSGVTLFRLIGGSLGTAVFGAIFAAGLARHLERMLPPGLGSGMATDGGAGLSPGMIAALEPGLRTIYINAFTASLRTVFLVAVVIALVGFVLTWFVPERPLRESIAAVAGDVGKEAEEVFPMPSDADSVRRLERALSLLATRDVKRDYIRRVVERAGVDLTPYEAWLLVRLDQHPGATPQWLERRYGADAGRIEATEAALRTRGMVEGEPGAGRQLTREGCRLLGELVRARREHLRAVLAEWDPEAREEIAARLELYPLDLVQDAPEGPIV